MNTFKHNNLKQNTLNNQTHSTMKKRVILATIAAMLIAGASIFASCSKEGEKNNTIILNANKTSYISNLEIAGQEHNRLLYNLGIMFKDELDSCATLLNASTYNDDDEAWILQIIQDSIAKMCTETAICPVSEDSLDYVFSNISYYSSEDFFNDEFANTASDFVLSNILITNSNATDVYPIYTDILTAIDNVNTAAMSQADSLLLAELVIFRYSLSFWSDAVDNIENPWHTLVTSIITLLCR